MYLYPCSVRRRRCISRRTAVGDKTGESFVGDDPPRAGDREAVSVGSDSGGGVKVEPVWPADDDADGGAGGGEGDGESLTRVEMTCLACAKRSLAFCTRAGSLDGGCGHKKRGDDPPEEIRMLLVVLLLLLLL